MKLIDERLTDGSRHFASLPLVDNWGTLCERVRLLAGARLLNCVGEGVARAWLDFRFQEHRFVAKVCDDGVRLIVHDPQCPDLVLYEVGRHFESLIKEDGV